MELGRAPERKNGARPSVVWKIFRRIGICEGQDGSPNPAYYVECGLCSKTLRQYACSTSCMRQHIRSNHEAELQELLAEEVLVKVESEESNEGPPVMAQPAQSQPYVNESQPWQVLKYPTQTKPNVNELPPPPVLKNPAQTQLDVNEPQQLQVLKHPAQTQPNVNVNSKIRRLQRCVDRIEASMDEPRSVATTSRQSRTSGEDSDFIYGQLIAIELRELCPAVAIQAKADIFNVLAEAHRKNLDYLELNDPSSDMPTVRLNAPGLLSGNIVRDL